MRTPSAIAIGLALALSPVLSAAAQSDAQRPVVESKNSIRTYVFKEKQAGRAGIRGRIKKVEGERVTFAVYEGPATWDEHRDFGLFTPASQFQIMQVVTQDTPEAQLELARWGLENGAPVQANYALATARSLANEPDLGSDLQKQIREQTAAQLKNRFHYELAQGRVATAAQTLRELDRHYSEVVAADVRAGMKVSLEAREAQFKQEKKEKAAQEAVARKDKEFQTKLKPIRSRVERGQAHIQRGLNAGSSMSKALGNFKSATRDLDQAVRASEQLRKQYGNEARYSSDITYVHEQATRSLTDALLHSASIQTSRGSFNAALGNVNRVLAMDPNNTRALAMRGRIEVAANEGWY